MWTSRPLHLWKNKKPFSHRLRKLGHLPTNQQARRLLIKFLKNLNDRIYKVRFYFYIYNILINPFNKILLQGRRHNDLPGYFALFSGNQTPKYPLMHKTLSAVAKFYKIWPLVAINALYIKLINNYFRQLYLLGWGLVLIAKYGFGVYR